MTPRLCDAARINPVLPSSILRGSRMSEEVVDRHVGAVLESCNSDRKTNVENRSRQGNVEAESSLHVCFIATHMMEFHLTQDKDLQ